MEILQVGKQQIENDIENAGVDLAIAVVWKSHRRPKKITTTVDGGSAPGHSESRDTPGNG